ncbi:malonic semialdehyde reductase [Saccharopolyspora sp. TS4A08]|uniref:Malonic semialdehyde reductase n=1 Tax=Saccharopolyspora ipomoeae TaxID=3042027 RepID=A0ABT6PTS2_9PSEU|nr:malonic semialdehyde reductase [Saccharopolyspora sp. TS4A08]MDI2031411.1 malonic semialdehyde reductase [Saccharopolyspora sp. TS4A08]
MTTSENTDLVLSAEAQDLLFREARTANSFSDEPVTDGQLRAIYDLMRWAPTSANAQPLRITAVRTPEAKARLLPLMAEGNRAKTASAPMTLLLSADRNFDEHMPRLLPFAPQAREMFADPQARAQAADYNATLQAGYTILAVRAAGLAAGPMLGFDPAGVDAEFFPDGGRHVVLVVNVGTPGPDPWFDRLPRLEYEEVVSLI